MKKPIWISNLYACFVVSFYLLIFLYSFFFQKTSDISIPAVDLWRAEITKKKKTQNKSRFRKYELTMNNFGRYKDCNHERFSSSSTRAQHLRANLKFSSNETATKKPWNHTNEIYFFFVCWLFREKNTQYTTIKSSHLKWSASLWTSKFEILFCFSFFAFFSSQAKI